MIPRDFFDDQDWCEAAGVNTDTEKVASDRVDVIKLASDQFAAHFVDDNMSSHPRFPMDTPHHTRVSASYLLSDRAGLSKQATAEVARNLLMGFYGHGMQAPEEIQELAKHAQMEGNTFISRDVYVHKVKTAYAQPEHSDYAVIINGVPRFPIRDEDEAKLASVWFETNFHDVPIPLRRQVAVALEKKASTKGVHLGPNGQTYLNDTLNPQFNTEMWKRAQVCPPNLKHAYKRIAVDGDGDLERLAYKVGELDKVARIEHLWNDVLPDPWQAVFAKVAEVKSTKVYGTERITPEEFKQLATITPRRMEEQLGHGEAQKFIQDPVGYYESAHVHLQRALREMAKSLRVQLHHEAF